jgi:hypothetical protein
MCEAFDVAMLLGKEGGISKIGERPGIYTLVTRSDDVG